MLHKYFCSVSCSRKRAETFPKNLKDKQVVAVGAEKGFNTSFCQLENWYKKKRECCFEEFYHIPKINSGELGLCPWP